MGTRIQSHQLKNGLFVSGRREQQQKEKQPTMAARAVPYTGGDIKKSGELGKMFDIPAVLEPPKAPPSRASTSSSGSIRNSSSGPIRNSSGPLNVVLPTGLFTSGPLGSGPLGSGPQRRSGQLDNSAVGSGTGSGSSKALYGSAATSLAGDVKVGFMVSRPVVWVVMVVVVMGLLVGAFLMVAVKKAVILLAVGAVLVPLIVGLIWNCAWGRRGLLGFVRRYPDTELRGAIDGQYVKVTGVVTCGSIPLESSYQKVHRCVYVSTELYEFRGLGGKSAHSKHRFFSWGSRHSEKFVADFYISDFQSGLRALVKAGYGAKVAPFVREATVVDVKKENMDLSSSFLRWLADRNLSSDDRIMRLKEGYIKEGSTVSVMGVVRRHDNVLMIVPPQEPLSTGCQWFRCLLPTYVEGLVLTCDDNQNADVVPV
ncbi:ubiquitin-specific protease family C19-related protein [Populus alba x Populus x berolinensis]|nr:ubiquitin-specific protease family C19-related protein [Populus alba x Populus x berolinensis]